MLYLFDFIIILIYYSCHDFLMFKLVHEGMVQKMFGIDNTYS